MQEREILLDLLGGTKHSIHCYTNAIMEGSNQQLRSTFQTLRDEAEQMQHQLYQMAEQKGYYQSAPGANQNDIQHIKSSLINNMNGNMSNTNINYAGGGQTNQQNVMSDTNSHAMINSNMMNTSNATSSISTNTANQDYSSSSNKKSKKK